MTKNEAIALADKRNAHKGKSLAHKEWIPFEEDGKWAVKLIDSPTFRAQQASKEMKDAVQDARMALMFGNFEGFSEAASRHLMAKVDCEQSQHELEEISRLKSSDQT